MSTFGNFKFANGANVNTNLASRTNDTSKLPHDTSKLLPPTKNCFIHFPVRSPSEDEDLHKYIPVSRSCPTSGILDYDIAKNDAVALEMAKLAVNEPIEEVASSFSIVLQILDDEASGRLGLSVDYSSGHEVRITAIESGLIQEWNRVHANRGEKLVNVGDIIASINGITDSVRMLQECRKKTPYVVDVVIKPTARGTNMSRIGSAGHKNGICRPCAYFHKPSGCVNIESCSYCHECPAGELKRRKQVKLFFRKMMFNISRKQFEAEAQQAEAEAKQAEAEAKQAEQGQKVRRNIIHSSN